MSTLLSLAVLILDIVAVVDVLKSSISNERKALWIALIVILPVVGMALYFLLGKKTLP